MRRRLVVALIVVNLLLAGALLLGPVAAQVFPKSLLKDCCEGTVCCDDCCWFVNDCQPGEGDCLK